MTSNTADTTNKKTAVWKFIPPLLIGPLLALMPPPSGLDLHAWYFFAIFASLVLGLMLEPLPGAALGLVSITVVTLLAPWVLFSPSELSKPGFKAAEASLKWALSGFSNGTIWLIFCAFMFALGYEKTGLGERLSLYLVKVLGRRSLTLGYAVALSDLLLAPVTPSNTARSGGVIFPIISHLPPLYQSQPTDAVSARRFGSYIMWVAIASTCVTSTLFLTALAPNLLALELVRKTAQVNITWTAWFMATWPLGLGLLALVPWLAYVLYPPTVKTSAEVQSWAASALVQKGPLHRQEWMLLALMLLALTLWIFAADVVNPTTTALLVVCAMVLTGLVSWSDMLKNTAAWNTLVWFATLVAMADGLSRVGFIAWVAKALGTQLSGLPVMATIMLLLALYYFSHYLFASVTAHVTAMLPVMLSMAATVPNMPVASFAMLLAMSHGLMGILTPYGTGPSPVYATSGYIPSAVFWRLGAVFGVLYFAAYAMTAWFWVL